LIGLVRQRLKRASVERVGLDSLTDRLVEAVSKQSPRPAATATVASAFQMVHAWMRVPSAEEEAVDDLRLTESYWPADPTEPVLGTTCGDVLRTAAERAPDAVALVAGVPDPAARRRISYAELLTEAERAARALLGRFAPGERVAVWAPNLPEWIVLQFGAALAGVTLVTVNPLYRAQELQYVLGQSGAAGIFLVPAVRGVSTVDLLDQVRPQLPTLRERVLFTDWASFCASGSPTEQLPTVDPGDPAQIQYTSGTTGFPKGAIIHHHGFTNNARYVAAQLQLASGEVLVNPMPLFHTAGSGCCTLGPMQVQATQVLMPFFDPALLLALNESERSAVLAGVPTMLFAVLDHPDFPHRDLSRVRLVFSGGALVPPHLVRRVRAALGIPFAIVYAQTEASPVITGTRITDGPEDQAETVGRPFPQTEVKIVDPATRQTAPVGRIGEICTRGYHVMSGYFDNPQGTAEAIDPQGWLHTGDLGSMDERGYCRIEGRVKEMIIRGGENIYPREIEMVLLEHAGVAEVAVVGVPDERWGEQVAAFIRPAADAAPAAAELEAFCRERLAPFKVPRFWLMVDAFPMTASGKVQKFALRERFTAGAPQAPAGTG
jgi:fatty-acyl-CoA synthase